EFAGGPDELFSFANNASENPTFYADLRNPQSLNKYQYSYNNPLRYVDPDGHCPACAATIEVGVALEFVPGAQPVATGVIIVGAAAAVGVGVYENRDAIARGARAAGRIIGSALEDIGRQ